MKQIIAKNRTEALKFVAGGRKSAQRLAYWKEGKQAFLFERLPGRQPTWQENVGGHAWSAFKSVAQKLGIKK